VSSSKLWELGGGLGLGALALALTRVPNDPAPSTAPGGGAPSTAPSGGAPSTAAPSTAPSGAAPSTAPSTAPSVKAPSSASSSAGAKEIASYTLDARLDPQSHRLTGKGSLRWKNASTEPARELWFHLYLNAFKNDRSLFLRSPFGAGRSGDHATDWGYIDVARLSVRELGGGDLWEHADRTSPGDPDDQTDIRVPLPAPIAPGQVVNVDFEWSAKLPSIVERTGYSGGFHMLGHWFPKIARREPDGSWAHFAFHPQAEFYADFGSYDVSLDVPAGEVVGATGRRVEERSEGGRLFLRYQADSVHDFAWTAWDRFQERRARIDDVDVHVLYPPGQDANADTTVAALAFALPRMSWKFGRYPHPTLTVVHPPEHAENAGGMEYPALITTGGPWWASRSGIRMVEAVTVHELGHQWFQGVIASNEEKWPFLDEGVNSYVEGDVLRAAYGPGSLVALPSLTFSDVALRRIAAVSAGHDDPIAQPASRFASFRSIGSLVYSRTATILETLARVYGRERLDRALSRYALEQRFGHPEPRDFLAVIERELGDGAAENLRRALFDKGWVDYLVEDSTCTDSAPPAGVFDHDGARITTEPRAPSAEKAFVCRVLVRRHGTLRFPVEVELGFEDGTRERRSWDGSADWISLEHRGPRRIASAEVDPERKILLDEALANNAQRLRKDFGHRTLERAIYWTELALEWGGP
jgi:hypothetical protein